MNPLFYVFAITHIFKQFDKEVKTLGWHSANNKLLKRLKIKTTTHITTIPSKGAVILYSDHPTGLDPYVISSVVPRDDLYFLSDVYQTKKGKHIASHILPVFYSDWKEVFKRPIISAIGYIMMRAANGFTQKEDRRTKNKHAISQAIDKLTEGHIVLVFPTGGNRSDLPWRRGLATIINEAFSKKIQLAVYKIQMTNLKEIKLIEHFLFAKRFYADHAVEIAFTKMDVENLAKLRDPEAISYFLQKDFEAGTVAA